MSFPFRATYLKTLEELDAVCASLIHQCQHTQLNHAEYLALNLKCLAEWEKDDAMAQECKRLAHFLHMCLSEPNLDRNQFIVSLNAHRAILQQLAQSPADKIETTSPENSPEKSPPTPRQHLALLAPENFRLGQLGSQLLWFGYSLQHVHTPDALLNLNNPPEAILVFSRFNGADLPQLAQLKKLLATQLKNIPLIFLAPKPSFEMQLAALRVGAANILSWPVGRDELVEAIEHAQPQNSPQHWHILLMARDGMTAFHAPLAKLGATITQVHDPANLIDLTISKRPDLLLIDNHQDYCDGIELARLVRQQTQLQPLPILILCHDSRQATWLAETAPAEIDGTLLKPVSDEVLMAAVQSRILRSHRRQAYWVMDLLTSLPPRSALPAALDNERRHSQQSESPLCLALLKLNNMPHLNELHGHAVGDRVLRASARFLKASLPKSAWLGRYSGASFVVLLPSHTQKLAAQRLEDIQDAYIRIADPNFDASLTYFSTALVEVLPHIATETLLAQADDLLAQAIARDTKKTS